MTEHWHTPRSRWARGLERLALGVERPLNRIIGATQLNPFYHTGTIAVFLLIVVAVTGFFIFLFFQYGFQDSYNSVVNRIEAPFIARTVRAVHRYASGALVITTLLHACRILFMERFRGPRWLAWLTGIAMTFILWLAGVTGYWLVWDQRAQLINEQFAAFLQQLTPWAASYRVAMVRAELTETSWPILLLILAAHVGLFGLTAVFYLYHIRHLARPRWFPEPVWMLAAAAVLLLISALFPSGLLPWFNPDQLPGPVLLDPIYLYYLPLNETPWANWLWGFMWLLTAVAALLPWLKPRSAPPPALVHILNDRCTGCTKCARDCPYDAIQMVDRNDDSGHQLLAVANPAKCVGCAICVGSCDDIYAIEVGNLHPLSAKNLLDEKLAQLKAAPKPTKIIFTCQRHADQGAAPFLRGLQTDELAIATLVLPCTGAVQPSLLPYALANGAAEVEIVGCPPYDCLHRMGNMLEEQRVTNERVPRLRRRYDHVPITAAWLPPDDFALALTPTPVPAADEPDAKPSYVEGRAMFQWLSWRSVVAGAVLLAVVLLGQVWLTGLPFTPYPDPPAVVQLTLADPAGYLLRGPGAMLYRPSQWRSGQAIPLRLEVDGAVVWETLYAADPFFAFQPDPIYAKLPLTPGPHAIHLYWTDPGSGFVGTLTRQTLTLAPGQILRLHDLGGTVLQR